MAQITYANKVALNENPEIALINKVTDDDMNEIKSVVNVNEVKVLLEVSNTAPDTCSTGDMYFNTTTNLIYTATATNTWGSTGVAPTSNTMYVTFADKTIYMYNGATLVKISSGIGDNEPIGKVVPMALETAPEGYLLCDGSTYTKTAYKDLYNALVGTDFIVDANTFTVPNLKGKVIVGKDSNDTDFDTLGETGGEKTSTLTANNIAYYSYGNVGASGNEMGVHDHIGDYTDFSNMQPYIVLNYFIKAQKLSGDVVLSESLPIGTEVDFDGQASDIPVGWEEIESYSTNEIKTGDAWIDGKPIYRKVLIGQNITPSTGLTPIGSISNLSTVIELKGTAYNSTNGLWLPLSSETVGGSFAFIEIRSNNIIPRTSEITLDYVYVIVEYTKTTD